jgi:hypothetical protein
MQVSESNVPLQLGTFLVVQVMKMMNGKRFAEHRSGLVQRHTFGASLTFN